MNESQAEARAGRKRLEPAGDAHAALRAIADRSARSKSDGNGGVLVTCGCHDDREPSLHVWVDDDGRLANHCFAGCDQAMTTACLERLIDVSLISPHDDDGWTPAGPAIASYAYCDETGRHLFTVCRTADKQFPGWRPDPTSTSGRRWRLKGGVRPVPYRLPELIAGVVAGSMIDLTDGEKDADAIVRAGGVATTLPHWAGDWRKNPAYVEFFRGAHVRVHRDRDGGQGQRQAAAALTALESVAASITLVEAATGKDVADHLAAGKTLDQLLLVDEHEPEHGEVLPAEPSRLPPEVFLDWSTVWQTRGDGEEWLYPDILARHRSHVIYANRKDGKSLLALFLSARLATSEQPIAVIYLDYEMTIEDLLERLDDMGYGPESDLSRFYYDLLPSLPPLDTGAGGEALMATIDWLRRARSGHEILVVVDTTSRAVHGPENDADTFRDFYAYTGIELKRRSITWVRLDHTGKDQQAGQRGSSGKADDVDVVWKLTKTRNGICLKRDLARMSWVPEQVNLAMAETPLRYLPVSGSWPQGTDEVASALDQLAVPLNAGRPTAERALKSIGEGRSHDLVAAALRFRRERDEGQR